MRRKIKLSIMVLKRKHQLKGTESPRHNTKSSQLLSRSNFRVCIVGHQCPRQNMCLRVAAHRLYLREAGGLMG